MKKGYIYKVIDEVNNPHRVVLMEDYVPTMTKIRGVGLTHNAVGGRYVKNMRLTKDYFIEDDENGKKYEFQWHDLGNGRVTSMIKKGFDKPVGLLIEPPVGQVKEEYLSIIAENVEEYIYCPGAIKDYIPAK